MSRVFLTALDLAKNELQNAVVQNLGSAPSSPVKGQLYFNSGDNTLYWYNGSAWTQATGGATSYGSVVTETTFGQASSNGVASTVSRSDHTHGTPTHDAAAHSGIPLSSLAVPTTDVAWNSKKITGLADPANAQDAATKAYVDAAIQGLDTKPSVKAASTANLTLSGTQTVDGVALVANDRCLVKDQSTPANNGIYLVQSGAWTRALDMDAWAEVPSAYTFVEQGTTNADTGWVVTADQGGTLGTTAITWTQFNGAGAVTAGAGLTKTGSTLDVGAGTGVTVAADSVALDTAYTDGRYPRLATANVAAATSTVVNHAFNTRDVLVEVYRNSTPWDTIDCDVERTDVNNVTVRFATAPAASAYRVVVRG